MPKWAVHTIVWFAIGALLAVSALLVSTENRVLIYWQIPGLICSCALFYFNYSFLVGQFWTKKKIGVFILLNIAAILVCMFFQYESYLFMFDHFAQVMAVSDEFDERVLAGVLSAAFIPSGLFVIILSSLIKTSSFFNQSQTRLKELENERIKAELEGLKSQINPHFLFNSLNAIYALIAMDQDKAQEATHALSNLLRYVLNEKNEEMVPLKEELKFTQDYIDLMSMRFSSDMLSLKVEIPEVSDGYMIAPMLLMTLIENAFKHGISNTSPSFILILTHIADDRLFATISNSLFPMNESGRREGGIGLDNLKKRLDLIYGDDASMTVSKDDDAYTAKLVIPLRR